MKCYPRSQHQLRTLLILYAVLAGITVNFLNPLFSTAACLPTMGVCAMNWGIQCDTLKEAVAACEAAKGPVNPGCYMYCYVPENGLGGVTLARICGNWSWAEGCWAIAQRCAPEDLCCLNNDPCCDKPNDPCCKDPCAQGCQCCP